MNLNLWSRTYVGTLQFSRQNFHGVFKFSENLDGKAPCPCGSHVGRVLLDEVYPLTTEQLFEILFSETPWYHNLEETVKKTEYASTPWVTERPTITSRTVTYTMSLNNAIGPRSTYVTEKQVHFTLTSFHHDGFCVAKEIQNAGIPCADSFIVQCTYCVIRAGNGHSRLLIHGAMVNKKSMWGIVKGIIEKSTYGGLESHYLVLEETLKLLCGNQLLPDDGQAAAAASSSEKKPSLVADLVPSKLLHGYGNIDISSLPAKILKISHRKK
ncbi:unnamed protein product [Gongylonema pulchrum]|uniref:VASt domain-containing protein n=1 Tax=Gongylonema pulchrum TaxID=637853 RepID=A0A183CUX2_9BILA|nr:unnamed protein product [Gongylonema pulchrum]